ncbi:MULTISPECIES: mechanosensitive ion channel family protein [unclassified Agarivorans]|uniref:mechanosensitive ion channel family protein n=1 Tax=unclassified Agarivorans TaxID=2636026 RepID=UPI0026E260E0|nr:MULTISPECIES: mechanosensitive ion channel family protein [unclassified Agarivorans]MDO6685754.1 mechanosensitive ion channel family protein [Agarivorans sp. 3_MG-2023]MDO6716131.1 mechanosensitive ion channel family protein [Agarivorans sp. 2_MG-2023]MDO6764297.1 mechanosensitive ion channel family protein [Agarivorans sp. 1_MG-2023]
MIDQELAQLESVYQTIVDFMVRYSFQLVGAIIIVLLGLWFASKVAKWLFKTLDGKGLDITLANFIANVVKILLISMTVIIALGKLGVSITPFVAALGAVSLGAGLAIQGTLSNYGAGLAIILTRPFVLKNTITVKGYTGIVEEINLATTVLVNEDNERVTIPNRHIVGEILKNTEQNSLVEGEVAVAYGSDPEQVIALIENTLATIAEVQSTPATKVGIDAFADSGINISYRFWVPTPIFHQTKFSANLAVFKALQQAGVQIPFPQREIRMLSADE